MKIMMKSGILYDDDNLSFLDLTKIKQRTSDIDDIFKDASMEA